MTTTIRRNGAILAGLFLTLGLMAATEPPKLPPGAVETRTGTYTYTDAEGKKWIYRKTPFGLAKFAEESASRPAAPVSEKVLAQTTAVEDGEFIRFERPGPFGIYRWKQKKTELNAMEQAAWDRARARRSADRQKE